MKFKAAVILMTIMMSVSAFADDGTGRYITFMAGGAEVKLDKTNGEIQKLLSSDKSIGTDTAPSKRLELVDVDIPEEKDGNAVTAIKQNGFCDYDAMKSLSLPDSLTKFGDYAFNGCDNLQTVVIPESVGEISRYCFYSCDLLANVTLPSSIEKIGDYAFSKCSALSKITIPKGVAEIGANAFEAAPIKSLALPDSVKTLGNAAFKNCADLSSVSIGSGLQTIPTDCFNGCKALESISISDSVKTIDHTAFSNCTGLAVVEIPDSVTKIASDAFNNSSKVTISCNPGSAADVFAKKAGLAITYRSASTFKTEKTEVPDVISVTIDGVKQSFTQDPVNSDGSVLVPMRAIFEALGADVSWDSISKTISASKGTTNISCKIDYVIATLNGKSITLNTAPKIINGTTMVPVRFVSESLDCNVSWEADTQTVIIKSR